MLWDDLHVVGLDFVGRAAAEAGDDPHEHIQQLLVPFEDAALSVAEKHAGELPPADARPRLHGAAKEVAVLLPRELEARLL